MSLNWVMVSPSAWPPFHALPKEVILHSTNKSISLAIESGKDLPQGDQRKKTVTCPAGTAYLTNLRIVYLPEKLSSSAEFQSFAAPIKRLSDSHITQPWFSANAFVATITPVKNGGIPHIAELKLVFKEGGAFEFYNTYTALLDRLQAQGNGEPVEHLEDLPVYSTDTAGQSEEPASPVQVTETDSVTESGAGGLAEDLPPAYDDVASDDGLRGRSRTRH